MYKDKKNLKRCNDSLHLSGSQSLQGIQGQKSRKKRFRRVLWHLSVVCLMLSVSAVFMSQAFAHLYDDAVEAGQYFESIGSVGSKAEDWNTELVPGASQESVRSSYEQVKRDMAKDL